MACSGKLGGAGAGGNHGLRDGLVGVNGFLAAAQDGGVAGFEARLAASAVTLGRDS
jgi:hypothetical protein